MCKCSQIQGALPLGETWDRPSDVFIERIGLDDTVWLAATCIQYIVCLLDKAGDSRIWFVTKVDENRTHYWNPGNTGRRKISFLPRANGLLV
jgi:hypothetical protein